MGFFDEIKKVVFGAKSVAKSAAGKALDAGDELAEKSADYLQSAKEKIDDKSEQVKNKAEELWSDTLESVESVGEKLVDSSKDLIEGAKDMAESVGEKIIDKSKGLIEGAKDLAESVGEKVIRTAEDLFDNDNKDNDNRTQTMNPPSSIVQELTYEHREFSKEGVEQSAPDEPQPGNRIEKFKNFTEDLGNDVLEKAKKWGDQLGEKLDDTIKKAEDLAKKEAEEPEYKAPNPHLKKSALEGDFFKKAQAFADGRYDEVRGESKPIVTQEPTNKQGNKTDNPLPGFEDLDGDGNELIDDAIIETDPKQ